MILYNINVARFQTCFVSQTWGSRFGSILNYLKKIRPVFSFSSLRLLACCEITEKWLKSLNYVCYGFAQYSFHYYSKVFIVWNCLDFMVVGYANLLYGLSCRDSFPNYLRFVRS